MTDRKKVVDAFLKNETPTRIPSSFWYHFVSFHDHYTALENEQVRQTIHDGQKKSILEMQPDFIKIMSDGYFGHPSVWENSIKKVEDLDNIKAVGGNHPWLDAQIDYVNESCKAAGSDAYIFYNIFSPLQYIRLKFEEYDEDMELFTRLFFEDTDRMVAAAKEIEKDIKLLVQRLFKETDIDGIYYSVQSIQDKRADNAFFKAYVEPSDLAILEEITQHTEMILLHMCGYGNYQNELSNYADYPVSAYNWAIYSENISLAEGKKIFKDKPVFGGFDNKEGTILYEGPDEELKAYIYHILDEVGTAGVALGADCTISENISIDRLNRIKEISKEYIQEKK